MPKRAYMIKLSIKEYNKIVKKINIESKNINFKKQPVSRSADILSSIRDSSVKYKITENSFAIVFEGAKLYSLNQIFALLQSRKYEIFKYKKEWHNKINKILNEISFTEKIPYFDCPVEITLLRGAKRMVDEDSLTTMFKYIIDALKKNENNINGVLTDDNQTIVNNIKCYSTKSQQVVGIKIEKVKEIKYSISSEDLLK